MTTIQFYHLTETPLEKALPRLLEKAYAAGIKCLVVARDEAQMDQLNQSLWTYQQLGFLPHGSSKDALAEVQPIYLSTTEENKNAATLFCTTGGATPQGAYARVLDVFDGHNEEAVTAARARFKAYKDQGAELSYFKQTDGKWEKSL
jgi:DNA polymerase III subunit chi